jgi:hypothetical protein
MLVCTNQVIIYHHQSGTGYGLKCQIAVDKEGIIYRISNVVEGSKHDLTLLLESGLLNVCSPSYRVLAHKAYLGFSDVMFTPIKRPRNGELTQDQKAFNLQIHSNRGIVENVFDVIKQWAIVGTTYTGHRHDLDFCYTYISYSLSSIK